MTNLFMPYTGYHLLLSLAIADTFPQDKNIIFLCNRAVQAAGYMETLLMMLPYKNIQVIALEQMPKSNFSRYFSKKRDLMHIQEHLNKIGNPDRFFYFAEWDVRTVRAAVLIKEGGYPAQFCFVEDGMGTYVEKERKRKNLYEKFSNGLLFGPWFKDYSVPGSLDPNCCVYAVMEEFLGAHFDGKTKHKIDLADFALRLNRDKLAALTGTSDATKYSNVGALIALNQDTQYIQSPTYKKQLAFIKELTEKNGCSIAFKRHPGSAKTCDESINFFFKELSAVELAGDLPIEYFYLRFRDTLKYVSGSLGTSMYTARCLLPDTLVESVVTKESLQTVPYARQMLELYKRLGIKVTLI